MEQFDITVRAPWHFATADGMRCPGQRGVTNGERRIRCNTCGTDIVVSNPPALLAVEA